MYQEKLGAIKQLIDKGIAPTSETVRTFLTWFDAARRGQRTVTLIRGCLEPVIDLCP